MFAKNIGIKLSILLCIPFHAPSNFEFRISNFNATSFLRDFSDLWRFYRYPRSRIFCWFPRGRCEEGVNGRIDRSGFSSAGGSRRCTENVATPSSSGPFEKCNDRSNKSTAPVPHPKMITYTRVCNDRGYEPRSADTVMSH